MQSDARDLGAYCLGGDQCAFRVWAPSAGKIELVLSAPEKRIIPLTQAGNGYFQTVMDGVRPGTRYAYRINGDLERPDPASRFQPEGVHGPSEVVEPDFPWTDTAWKGMPLRDFILYELHVGTFTDEGTFVALISRLSELKELGITAVELMPVAQFPGSRNWGYDGVYPFAAQNSYGGPAGLKRLVNACHAEGLAVVLDVVYNHLGPEGNYLSDFAPYFTDRYKTPWGWAINFDGPHSDDVRRYFIANALYWQTECHIDALRLDAVHAICDFSAQPFLGELAAVTRRRAGELKRAFHLIAESDLNDARIILPPQVNGCGVDAQWSDDFHHALHVLLTNESGGYYADFGGTEPLVEVMREGYAYRGQYSRYRKRRHGNSPEEARARQFVVCAQNHDQVGNRLKGDRLSTLVSFESLKLAAGTVLLSPFVPLLFMGEEYGETAPFQYFVSHSNPGLIEAVRNGRADEFAAFQWQGEVPDPQAEATFQQSKLNPALAGKGHHRLLREFHRELIRLRTSLPAIAEAEKESVEVTHDVERSLVWLHYRHGGEPVAVLLCFAETAGQTPWPALDGVWKKLLDSAAARWDGPGSTLPGQVDSTHPASLPVTGRSVALFQGRK